VSAVVRSYTDTHTPVTTLLHPNTLPHPPPQTSDRSLVWNTDLIETMELENLLINAAITMHSAERRKVRGNKQNGTERPVHLNCIAVMQTCAVQASRCMQMPGKEAPFLNKRWSG